MINLWLDDIREAPEGYEWAHSYEEAVYYLDTFKVNTLDLDHDLGEEKDGADVLQYALQNNPPKSVILHTANPVGRAEMERMWERFRAIGPDDVGYHCCVGQ